MARGIHGNEGKILVGSSTIAELTKWEGTLAKNLVMYTSQDGAPWQKTVTGNKAFSGTITGKYDPDDPIDAVLDTDALVALRLHQNSAKYVDLQARLGDLSFTDDIDGNAIQEWTCTFESDGAVSFV